MQTDSSKCSLTVNLKLKISKKSIGKRLLFRRSYILNEVQDLVVEERNGNQRLVYIKESETKIDTLYRSKNKVE